MDFTPSGVAVEHPAVGAEHVADFYVEYMRRDNLGRIANAHLVWADKKADGVRSDECLRLAKLQSAAVDFAKSGVSADFPFDLTHHTTPHFMPKKDKPSYVSKKVIGRLYDEAKEAKEERSSGGAGGGPVGCPFDEDLRVEGWEAYRADALKMR